MSVLLAEASCGLSCSSICFVLFVFSPPRVWHYDIDARLEKYSQQVASVLEKTKKERKKEPREPDSLSHMVGEVCSFGIHFVFKTIELVCRNHAE